MQARYCYRIEPTAPQAAMLARTFGCARVVFNDALRCRDEAYQAGGRLSPAEIQRRVITEGKATEARGWLAEVASVALVQSVRDADRAFRNCPTRWQNAARAGGWGIPGSSPARTTGSRAG